MSKHNKKPDPPVNDIPKEEFHSDMIQLNDILSTYNKTPNEFAELIGFADLYIRNISKGLRPINFELQKALKEYTRTHPK